MINKEQELSKGLTDCLQAFHRDNELRGVVHLKPDHTMLIAYRGEKSIKEQALDWHFDGHQSFHKFESGGDYDECMRQFVRFLFVTRS